MNVVAHQVHLVMRLPLGWMGGQLGGMVNEGGYFPEVCKKSFQAMVSDMQSGITPGSPDSTV